MYTMESLSRLLRLFLAGWLASSRASATWSFLLSARRFLLIKTLTLILALAARLPALFFFLCVFFFILLISAVDGCSRKYFPCLSSVGNLQSS